jgi:hypothetical protein
MPLMPPLPLPLPMSVSAARRTGGRASGGRLAGWV